MAAAVVSEPVMLLKLVSCGDMDSLLGVSLQCAVRFHFHLYEAKVFSLILVPHNFKKALEHVVTVFGFAAADEVLALNNTCFGCRLDVLGRFEGFDYSSDCSAAEKNAGRR